MPILYSKKSLQPVLNLRIKNKVCHGDTLCLVLFIIVTNHNIAEIIINNQYLLCQPDITEL